MTSYQQAFLLFGAFFGLLAVTAGAFGAHFMKSRFSSEMLQTFEIAVRYQMYHSIALIVLAALLAVLSSFWFHYAGVLLISGTLVFSGSLYVLVLTGVRAWGAVTPVGGILLILGWLGIFLGALFPQSH